MPVVVVESPAKAKTIEKYLGGDYRVLASFGHVRDLPPKDGSVDPDADFAMKWEFAADSRKHLKAIKDALKDDRDTFFDSFTQDFFTANEELKVTESDRQKAIELAHQSSQVAALGCMKAFGTTDFRDDLRQIQVPVLVLTARRSAEDEAIAAADTLLLTVDQTGPACHTGTRTCFTGRELVMPPAAVDPEEAAR